MNSDEIPLFVRRRPSTAASLSALLPGLGHLYCGKLARGLGWMVLCVLLMLAAMAVLTVANSRRGVTVAVWFLGAEVLIWLAGMAGAWQTARRMRDPYRLRDYNRWYVYAALVLMGAFSSAVGMAFVLRDRAIHAFHIPTNSMAPTVNAGDRVLALKETFLDRNPERGELIVYRPAFNRRQVYLKRVIGVAGDHVEWSGTGEVRVNGSVLPHVPASTAGDFLETNGSRTYTIRLQNENGSAAGPQASGSLVVPPDQCFVMGDNRPQSQDSRTIGCNSYASLFAEPVAKYGLGFSRLR